MTVAELIQALSNLVSESPSVADLPVLSDGCDCWGEAGTIRVVPQNNGWHETVLLIERRENMR
jgi:hypothetical protein